MIEVVLFHKQDCDLCEQVLAELQSFIQGHGLERQVSLQLKDILDRTEWYDQYSDRIPVVAVNGQVVSHYFLDEPALCEALGIDSGKTDR